MYLVAEADPDSEYKEIYVGLEDEHGVWYDLTCIGQRYKYTPDLEYIPNQYRVLLWNRNGDDDAEEVIIEKT